MDGLEATMDKIGYERERGVERGDQVRDESDALLVINRVAKSRRGVNLRSNCKLYHPQPSHCKHLTLDICGLLHVLKGHGS